MVEFVGYMGFALILIGMLQKDKRLLHEMCGAGSFFLIIYSMFLGSIPYILLNIVMVLVNVRGVMHEIQD